LVLVEFSLDKDKGILHEEKAGTRVEEQALKGELGQVGEGDGYMCPIGGILRIGAELHGMDRISSTCSRYGLVADNILQAGGHLWEP
jgi:hypothetical protein